MKLTMLGTGNALVTDCYNTCFLIEDSGQTFLIDGGGGNTILKQIKSAGYDWMKVRHIFVTHKHIDHLLGVIWMVRMICQFMSHGDYEGEAYIYSHNEVLDLIRGMAKNLLRKKESDFIDKRLYLIEVTDGQLFDIIGHKTMFFDIKSTKAKQFGFCMDIGNEKKLTCCGDEPMTDECKKYELNCDWLIQ